MKLALIALSKHGKALGQKIKAKYPGSLDFFVQENQYQGEAGITSFPAGNLGQLVTDIFPRYQGLIFIMALGIVVRKIAPHIQDKRIDPAVVVIDEKGQSVISVLSGHLGGANQLAREIAQAIQSRAIITTATDLHQRLALDLLAQQLNCTIKPFSNLKKISGAVVNDQQVAFYSDYPLPIEENARLQVYPLQDYSGKGEADAVVLVTNKLLVPPVDKPYAFLVPKNVAIGLGCRRGTSKEKILTAINLALEKAGLQRESIACLASIDLKADETGILEAAEDLGLPIKFFIKEQIAQLEGEYASSTFVQEKIGVNGVCEQTALLALKKPQLVLPKSVLVPAVTVAVAEEQFL